MLSHYRSLTCCGVVLFALAVVGACGDDDQNDCRGIDEVGPGKGGQAFIRKCGDEVPDSGFGTSGRGGNSGKGGVGGAGRGGSGGVSGGAGSDDDAGIDEDAGTR